MEIGPNVDGIRPAVEASTAMRGTCSTSVHEGGAMP
jgi:hypothetical protein